MNQVLTVNVSGRRSSTSNRVIDVFVLRHNIKNFLFYLVCPPLLQQLHYQLWDHRISIRFQKRTRMLLFPHSTRICETRNKTELSCINISSLAVFHYLFAHKISVLFYHIFSELHFRCLLTIWGFCGFSQSYQPYSYITWRRIIRITFFFGFKPHVTIVNSLITFQWKKLLQFKFSPTICSTAVVCSFFSFSEM